MRIAFVGPLQSGKSTLFRAVTGQAASDQHLMGEHIAVVKVPDPRLEFLQRLFKTKKVVEATIECLDVPGFSHETAQSQSEFRKSLPHIRQCDALVAVVRGFDNPTVPAYRNRVDARADLEELESELMFCDLESVTGRIEKLQKELKKPKSHDEEKHQLELLQRCQNALENEQPLSKVIQSDEERKMVSSFAFLTELPLVVVINVNEAEASAPVPFDYPHAHTTIALCADTEEQIAKLDPQDRQAFMEDLGVGESAHDRLIQACYGAVGLISFMTHNQEEVRAWSIKQGTEAVEAAGKIHTDMARGFIRAETVAYEDLEAAGDMKAAKAGAKVRLEGKHYIVEDGDVITFRFNV
ncbi:MAG: redox-regulated ATPase YchF [Planctomycetota bacterium]|nr:MAG: redox-regulated ATPase YchF [Planctomycetota bacterium]